MLILISADDIQNTLLFINPRIKLRYCNKPGLSEFLYYSYITSKKLFNSVYCISNLKMKKRTGCPHHLIQNQSVNSWKFPFLLLLFDSLF